MNFNQVPMMEYVVFVFLLIDLILKGIALWKAARHSQRNWFIAIFLLNTAGILPAIYLYFFQGKPTPEWMKRFKIFPTFRRSSSK